MYVKYFTHRLTRDEEAAQIKQEMGMLGFSVMLGALTDNSASAKTVSDAIGKRIRSLSLGDDDALHFEMADGSKFKLYDDGQSCCESRYMRTDDKLSDFVGAMFTGAEIKDAPSVNDDDCGEHEVQFLEIKTDRGVFTMTSHNEHNGYYGGFLIRAESE